MVFLAGFHGTPPLLCTNGSAGYLVQLSVIKELFLHGSLPSWTNLYPGFSTQLWIVCPCVQGGVWGGWAPSEAGKFYNLETESCNLLNIFRWKFNKMMKTKFQFNRPQLRIMGELGYRWLHRPSPWSNQGVKHCREYIPIPLRLWLCTSRLC